MEVTTSRAVVSSLRCGVALGAILISSTAFAQESDNKSEQATAETEIVVTGTLIRGIAPSGSQVLGISDEKKDALGAGNASQILASLPQVGNQFNAMPAGVSALSGSNGSNPINRPNLRDLPRADTSGGAQTLVMLDGHRVVGGGTQQVAVDPDFLATAAIARVEAMTDGGSAVYGSDALGGVINFITRKKYDGVQASYRFGVGDNYESHTATALAGRDWGSGGLYVAYGFTHHDSIFGADRDWAKRIDWLTGEPSGGNCPTPNVVDPYTGASFYPNAAGTALIAGTAYCDSAKNVALYPETTTHNVFARLTQDLSPGVSFDMTGFYAHRRTTGNGGALINNRPIVMTPATANPYYINDGQSGIETITLDFSPYNGERANIQRTVLETWQVSPSFSVDIGSSWQARALFSYGKSRVSYDNNVLDPVALGAAAAAGSFASAINPYNILDSLTDPSVLANIADGRESGFGKNEMIDTRLIADGPVFSLPAGDVHVAVGAEYMQNKFQRQATDPNSLILSPVYSYKQTVKSLFGEIQVPLLSDVTAINELNLSGSIRYDKYNDFGSTTNPKVGLTYKPVDWITVRGNWGKSFNAPSPTDQLGQFTGYAAPVPSAYIQWPCGYTDANGTAVPNSGCAIAGAGEVFLGGGSHTLLKPQTANQWSLGVEFMPPVIEGLTLGASYYLIDLKGTIGRPVTGASLSDFFTSFPSLFIYNPSYNNVIAFLTDPTRGGVSSSTAAITQLGADPSAPGSAAFYGTPVGMIIDTLVQNLGQTKLSGIDFSASYQKRTGFGSVDLTTAGNVRLSQKTKGFSAAVTDDLQYDLPKFRISTTLGTNVGNLRAQVTWNHTAGYRRSDYLTSLAYYGTPVAQERLKAFDQINLFFKYDVKADGWGKDLAFTVNVDNLFDVGPPQYRYSTQNGYTGKGSDPFSIGRVVQIGVSKKFF